MWYYYIVHVGLQGLPNSLLVSVDPSIFSAGVWLEPSLSTGATTSVPSSRESNRCTLCTLYEREEYIMLIQSIFIQYESKIFNTSIIYPTPC